MSSGAYLYARYVMGDGINRVGRVCGRLEILRAPPGAVVLLVAAAVLAGAPREAAGQCHYTYVTLPNPPGWSCQAHAINNRGWVTGQLGNAGDNYRAFVWRPETGTSMLPIPTGYFSQTASDINDHGHVVGSLLGSAGAAAYLWDGQTTTIIHHPPWANGITAYGVNNRDQVVGIINNNLTGPFHAFLWQDGNLIDLTPDFEHAEARRINEQGVIAGFVGGGTTTHAFTIDAQEIDLLTEPDSIAASAGWGLNNGEMVVGLATTVTDPLDPAFRRLGAVWSGVGLQLTSPPNGTRDLVWTGLNDAGRAAGYYARPSGAAVWQNGHATNLVPLVQPAAPSGLRNARDINNAGQIISWISNGSVVLNPVWTQSDLTGDCHVTVDDLVIVLSNFGSPIGSYPMGDVDIDGDVDVSDLTLLLSNWGE